MNKRIQIENLSIEYWESGNGPRLVFLHGAFGSYRFYLPILEELAKRYTVMAPVLPGMGKSQASKNELTLDKYSCVVKSFIEKKVQLEEIDIVGHSLGGMIACLLLQDENISLNKIVLINPAAYPLKRYFLRTVLGWGQMIIQHLKSIRQLKVGELIPWDAVNVVFKRPLSFLKIIQFLRNARYPKFRSDIKKDIVIASSIDDKYVPYAHSQHIHKKYPHSKLIRIETGGHNWFYYQRKRLIEIIG